MPILSTHLKITTFGRTAHTLTSLGLFLNGSRRMKPLALEEQILKASCNSVAGARLQQAMGWRTCTLAVSLNTPKPARYSTEYPLADITKGTGGPSCWSHTSRVTGR